MKLRRNILVALLCLAAAGLCGCRRNIVRAAPPSVTTPPDTEPFPQPTVVNPQPAAAPAEPPDIKSPAEPVPAVAEQPRPRPPVEAEVAAPKAEPEPEPVQIAPQLSAKDQAAAVRTTTDDIQVAYGRQLSASQNDLVGKIAGFLAQAHEAIRTGDWVRAQNLAQKAQVLSVELVKSL